MQTQDIGVGESISRLAFRVSRPPPEARMTSAKGFGPDSAMKTRSRPGKGSRGASKTLSGARKSRNAKRQTPNAKRPWTPGCCFAR
jgi:hypothetical protein